MHWFILIIDANDTVASFVLFPTCLDTESKYYNKTACFLYVYHLLSCKLALSHLMMWITMFEAHHAHTTYNHHHPPRWLLAILCRDVVYRVCTTFVSRMPLWWLADLHRDVSHHAKTTVSTHPSRTRLEANHLGGCTHEGQHNMVPMTPTRTNIHFDHHYRVNAISKWAWFDPLTSNTHFIGERSQE